MKDILSQSGIEFMPPIKKAVDQAFRQIVDVEYKNCSPARRKIKEHFVGDELKKQPLIGKLNKLMKLSPQIFPLHCFDNCKF
jgi:hypothetical protein